MKKQFLLLFLSLTMVGGAGVLGAATLSQGAAEPTRTVTIDVSNGETGATGPAGPAGPPGPSGEQGSPGATECSVGSTLSNLVINTPDGHVELTNVCIKD
jgi:hypothetical protein